MSVFGIPEDDRTRRHRQLWHLSPVGGETQQQPFRGLGAGSVPPGQALSPLEVAAGGPIGLDSSAPPLRIARKTTGGPVGALEEVLATALARPPCVVSFSGGRDSSGLLALATKVSRELGLQLPVPATLVFPGDARAAEGEWQALVLRELGLNEWARIEVPPGWLDLVGPVSSAVLRRHGLLWPPNAHLHYPIIQQAAGGSVVTGFAGDELAVASQSARAERLLARQEHDRASRTLATVGLELSPRLVKRAVYWRRFDEKRPWLTRDADARVRAASARASASYPFGFDRKLGWAWRSRYFRVARRSLEALGSSCDVKVCSPFATAEVMGALAARGGIPGLGDRKDLVRLLFGGVLPPAALERTSKATFSSQVWTETATSFACEWSGEGIDDRLVNLDRLRKHWLSADRSVSSAALLQAAWLHDHG